MALWLRMPILGMLRLIDSLRGRERWLVSRTAITRPGDTWQRSEPARLEPVVRAGLVSSPAGPSLNISSGQAEFRIGPFADEATARRLEADLRARRPEWFLEPDGTPTLYASPTPPDYGGVPEAVTRYEITYLPEGFDLILHHLSSPQRRKDIPLLILWCLGWTIGAGAVAIFLLRGLLRPGPHDLAVEATTRPSRNPDPPAIFAIFFPIMWALGMGFGWKSLILRFRRTELWHFRQEQITAGRTWQFPARRQFPTDRPIHVRPLAGQLGPGVELVCDGKSLPLGPFTTPEEAARLLHDLRRLRPYWHWHA